MARRIRHRTAALRLTGASAASPSRLPGLLAARSRLHPLPRVARQLAHQHRQRLLRRLPVPPVDVGVACRASATVAWLAVTAGSCVAGAADVHRLAHLDLRRPVVVRVGNGWHLRVEVIV